MMYCSALSHDPSNTGVGDKRPKISVLKLSIICNVLAH